MEVPGIPVVIHGRGFPNRSVPENLVKEYPPAVTGKFNLGLLHTSLTGRPGHDNYAPCSVADLSDKGYGYWALGHIHQPEVISQDPWIVFSGNCQGRHARETGPRGCRLVTVNESLSVENAEFKALDVVRWQIIELDLTSVSEESEAMRLISEAMTKAVSEADHRLLAARIILTGATPLHGSLIREGPRWRAELLGRAQDHGPEALWIEQIKIETKPVYDVSQLAERDALTKQVVTSLEGEGNDLITLPIDILEMLDVLPIEVRNRIDKEWISGNRAAILDDVRSIVLDALVTKGGQAS